jgi:hypothetical protein
MSMPRVEDPLDVKYGREIGKAGCFRFFEAVDANGVPSILQCAADPSNVELAARRMRHEISIVSDFRGRSVAPFVYWSESAAIALWHDNGFRPALQRVNLVRDGLDVVLSQLIQISETIRGLHAVGVVHGALFPYGPWVSEAIDDVRFADCSLAFTLGQGFGTPQPWGLVGDDDLDRLSPEQTGQTLSPLDERTDCYGLGLLIEAIVDKGRGASVIVPEGLRQLVDLMTAGSPEVRPSSVAAVIEELHKMEVTRIARVRIPTDPGAVRTGSAAGDTKPKFRVEPAGRENLIEELRSIWVAPGGRALVIAGQPGIGKTELARLFAKEVELGGGVVTYAKGDPIRQSQPLIALRRVVRQLCAQILLRGPEEADRIRTSVKTALAEECQLLVAAVPEALPLVGVIRETTPIASPLTAQRSMWAISQMISTVADACGGLCIIFDDVQWLDQGSLSVIDGLLAHIERTPITLLMVARATLDQVLPEVAKGLRRIDVESLSCEGVEAILVKSCPGGVARQQDLARQLHTLSGGNPLYVTQILHHMTSRGKLYWDAVRQRWNWQADGFTDLAVSEDILRTCDGLCT